MDIHIDDDYDLDLLTNEELLEVLKQSTDRIEEVLQSYSTTWLTEHEEIAYELQKREEQ